MTSLFKPNFFGKNNHNRRSVSPHSQCSYADVSITSDFSDFANVSLVSSSSFRSRKSTQSWAFNPFFNKNHPERPYKRPYTPQRGFPKRRYFHSNPGSRHSSPQHLPYFGKSRHGPGIPHTFSRFQSSNTPSSANCSRSSTPMPALVPGPIFPQNDVPGPSWMEPGTEPLESPAEKKMKHENFLTRSIGPPGIQTAIRHAFPDSKLTECQVNFIQSQLIEAIDNTPKQKSPPRFLKSFYDQGVFWMVCADEKTREWLIENVNILNELWEDLNLKVDTVKIPKRPVVYVDLPEQDKAVEVLDRLATQNKGLHTDGWLVLNRKLFRTRQRITFSIDMASLEYLKSKNFTVAWKLKTVVFKAPSKADRNRAGKWLRGRPGMEFNFLSKF